MFISRNDYQKLVNSYKRISGSSIYRLSFINFLANIIESVGILMFIPLFSSRYQATGTNSNNMIVEFVNNLFTFFVEKFI